MASRYDISAADLEASARIPESEQVIEIPGQTMPVPHIEAPGENEAIRAGG
jgi:hypothetical protein